MTPWQLFSLASLVLQFDGSLRPPRDPGFRTTDTRVPACGAVILSTSGQVIALGGKTFPLLPGMTSADAEFEGLLMGLRFLRDHTDIIDHHDEELIVEGDCKAIIDQLNDRAQPRKLQTKFNQATKYLSCFSRPEIRHIFRDQNHQADSICEIVIRLVVENEIWKLLHELDLGLSSPHETRTPTLLQTYFGQQSIIPYSQRLSLYSKIKEKAIDSNDGSTLIHLGQLLQSDSKYWPKSTDAHGAGFTKDNLLVEAIMLQIDGHRALGKPIEAAKLERKHSFRLAAFSKRLTYPRYESEVSDDHESRDRTVWELHASSAFSSSRESLRSECCETWKIIEN